MLKDEFIMYLEKQTDEPFFVIESVLKAALQSGEVVLRSDVDELVSAANAIKFKFEPMTTDDERKIDAFLKALSKFKPKAGE